MIGEKAKITLRKYSLFIIFLSNPLWAINPDPFNGKLSERKYLKLADGKEIILKRLFESSAPPPRMRVFLRNHGKVLWDVTYYNDFDIWFWESAFFIPIVENQLYVDLNNDGYPEIAIAVWHGGKLVETCSAAIFTVKEDRLVFLKTQNINYELSRYVYNNKDDFNNLQYKCPVCK